MAPLRVCFHITPHGFGHAARCLAVAERLLAEQPSSTVELRTSVAPWFFETMPGERCLLSAPPRPLDPGVVQSDSFHHDIPATLAAWQQLLLGAEELVQAEAEHLRRSGCSVVVSDSAPLALAAARRAGLPAVAMGNFTWDWVLEDYLGREPAFGAVIAAIRAWYRLADLFLRLPMSHDTDLFSRQLPIGFTPRRARVSPERTREALGLRRDQLVVLLSFGGFGVDHLDLDRVARFPGVRCLWDRGPSRPPVLVSARGMGLHYPDLIRAADVILTKPGYSIIAEAVAGDTRIAYAPRHGFRESALLERFLRDRWPSLAIPPESLADGSWADLVIPWAADDVTRQGPASPPDLDGASRAVQAICGLA